MSSEWEDWAAANPGKGFDQAPVEIRQAAWEAGGSTDYNKKVAEGEPGYQSTNPTITPGSGTGPGSPYALANPGSSTQQPVDQTLLKALQQQIELLNQQQSQQQPDTSAGEPVAIDGQRFSQQPSNIQELFIRTWGDRTTAAQHWVNEHNMAVINNQNGVDQGSTPTQGSDPGSIYYNPSTNLTDGTGTNTAQMSTMNKLQAWVQKNPIAAMVGAAIAGSMLFGGGRRRW